MKKYIFVAIVIAQFIALQSVKAGDSVVSPDGTCTINISSLAASVQPGQSTTISWTSSGCATVTIYKDPVAYSNYSSTPIDQQDALSLDNNGSFPTGALNQSTGYTIAGLANSNQFVTQEIGVNVITPDSSVIAHANGTNIISNGTIYLIQGDQREPYTSAGDFLSYGFNSWSNVQQANAADLAMPIAMYTQSGTTQSRTYFVAPRNGSLINDNGTIYIITGGLRAGFSSAAIFLDLGYSFSNAISGDTSFLTTLAPINSASISHPDGTVINENGTLYIMQNGYRLGIPSMDVLTSWGLKIPEVVTANSYDIAAQQSGILETKMANQFEI